MFALGWALIVVAAALGVWVVVDIAINAHRYRQMLRIAERHDGSIDSDGQELLIRRQALYTWWRPLVAIAGILIALLGNAIKDVG